MNNELPFLDPSLNCLPEKITSIHIMGICGTGMAALAGMLLASGYRVSGSDANVYPPMSDFLRTLNIPVHSGYTATHLDSSPDLVIIGNVIRRTNPEALAVAERKLHYLSFPQALAQFFIQGRTSFVVAGTHGKTTTCSILASCLFHCQLDPSFMIGGILRQFDANFRLGKGNYFVSEGDEYDTAFFDKGSKFLHYLPEIAILTSLEFDHADIFSSLQDIKNSFRKFVALVPENGLIIANLDEPNVVEVVQSARCQVVGYGLKPENEWQLASFQQEHNLTSFSVFHQGTHWHDFAIPSPGRHNCLNALAVILALNHIGVPVADITESLRKFSGVKRRQEVRGKRWQVTVIDDFAHHPTAVRETLNALNKAYPGQRLIAVFEPRTNSSRRSIFQKDYAVSFDDAEIIYLREPLPLDTVDRTEMFSSVQLAEDLHKRGKNASAYATTDEILHALNDTVQPGDVVAILSNGGFDNIHSRLLDLLAAKENSNA